MSNFKFTEAEENVIYSLSIDLDSREISFHKFIKGIEQIINERDGWISVDEKLPEQDTFVIGHKHNGLVLGLYFNADYEFKYGDQYQTEQVTHWQPLPNPPKSKT